MFEDGKLVFLLGKSAVNQLQSLFAQSKLLFGFSSRLGLLDDAKQRSLDTLTQTTSGILGHLRLIGRVAESTMKDT